MKKQIDENIAIQISRTKNIEAFQEKSALETLMSLIAEGKVNITGIDDNASFLQKLKTEIHTPAKNIELENQLKHIEAIKHAVEFSVKKTETEKKQLAAQKDAFLKRINNFKEENDKTKAELEEPRLELEAKGKMLLQAQDEIAVKQQALETKEKLILENGDIDAKLESLVALKEDLRLESLKKLEEMREFKETKDQIQSELDDRVAMVEARERELEEKEMAAQLVNKVDVEIQSEVFVNPKEITLVDNIYQDLMRIPANINGNHLSTQAVTGLRDMATNLANKIKVDLFNAFKESNSLKVEFGSLIYKQNRLENLIKEENDKILELNNRTERTKIVEKSILEEQQEIFSLKELIIKEKDQLNKDKQNIELEKQYLLTEREKFGQEIQRKQKEFTQSIDHQRQFEQQKLDQLKRQVDQQIEMQKNQTKKELEKYNAEIDTKVLELVAIKQVQDGDVILDRYEQIKNTKDYIDNSNKELGQKYNMMVSREKNLTNLKAQIYKNPEYIQKSDATTQSFDPEFEARAKNITTKFYDNVIAEKNITSAIKYREKELGEIIKERALYEYHGEVVDAATQYESTDNEIMDMLKTLAQINENSENPLSKEAFYNRIDDMESKLIMSQLATEYLDKSIVKKSHKLATLNQAFQARKYLDEHKTVESLRVEVVKDLMTKKIAPKFDAFLLREQNIGLDMQKSLFDAADQHIAEHHDQFDNQTNLLGQEVHNDFYF